MTGLTRRGFLNWLAKGAAIAAMPLTLARKHTPIGRIWPIKEATVDLGNGWIRTTKIYSDIPSLPPGTWVFSYEHRGKADANIVKDQLQITASDGIVPKNIIMGSDI